MPASPDDDVRRAIEHLWQEGVASWNTLYRAPAYAALREACQRHFPDASSVQTLNFALSRAVRALGFRTFDMEPDGAPRATPAEAAQRLCRAFTQTTLRRTYLAPLDGAGDVPGMAFGPAQIRRFTPIEFDALVRSHEPTRNWPRSAIDAQAFSQFTWLVIEDVEPLEACVSTRALPELSFDPREDFGRINPHATAHPKPVEDALFALMTFPWEEVVEHAKLDWRPFGLPCTITLEDDLFGGAPSFPSSDTLAWTWRMQQVDDDEVVEIREPARHEIDSDDWPRITLDQTRWEAIEQARATSLFDAPVAHFLNRGMLASGIDEFMAHMVALEAGFGSEADTKGPRKLPDGTNPGPNQRVGIRLAHLFGDPFAGWLYTALFQKRNAYVHGRTMTAISSEDRLAARGLARRAVCRLIDLANEAGPSADRDALLRTLLTLPGS
jgi:hypothetical protein